MHRFILQAIDPHLGCPVLEALLLVDDLETLRLLLGEEASADSELRGGYLLDPAHLSAICARYETAFDPGQEECWLGRAHSIRSVPYLVHTEYELALMLEGVKPLAVWSIGYPLERGDFPSEALFEPHVQSGTLIQRVIDEPFDKPIRSRGRVWDGTRHFYYARQGEEWRIDAYRLVWQQLDFGPWNETLERLYGSLLGYTDAQNDWWLAQRRRHNATATYTDRTAYVAVDAAELAWIRAVGERAFRPERSGVALELVLHGLCPEPAIMERWLVASEGAAIVRFGLPRDFFTGRKFADRGGSRSYLIEPEQVVALNRALTSSLEVVAARE